MLIVTLEGKMLGERPEKIIFIQASNRSLEISTVRSMALIFAGADAGFLPGEGTQ